MEKFMWVVLSTFLLVLVAGVRGAQVPAMFVFGDSLNDPGNNNRLLSFAKANHPFYGIDFPNGVTGRFCNGATVADYLGYFLELGLIPAVKDSKGSKALQGVNFASAAAGILDDTGSAYGKVIPLSEQLKTFGDKILPSLSSQVLKFKGEVLSIGDFLAKSLFFVDIGSNDFLHHYFLPYANPLKKPVPAAFEDSLISKYTLHLKKLYIYGARKFLVPGLSPVGCVPTIIASYSEELNQCYEPYNQVILGFNTKVEMMIQQLNKDLPAAYFLYWDVYSSSKDAIDNPSKYGFKDSHSACCGKGRANAETMCSSTTFLCRNRSEYAFWDSFHPTDAANKISATLAYEGTLQSVFPMNVKQLIAM